MKRAVLIGITYCNSARKTLSGSWSDMATLNEILNFDEITLLYDEKHDKNFAMPCSPTKTNIMGKIKKIIEESHSGDTLLIYFSGHAENMSDNRLITADDQEITSAEFTDLIMTVKNTVITRIILDCSNTGKLLRLPFRYINTNNYIETPFLCKKDIILLTSSSCLQSGELTNGELTHALSKFDGKNWLELFADISNTLKNYKKTPQMLTSNLNNLKLSTGF